MITLILYSFQVNVASGKGSVLKSSCLSNHTQRTKFTERLAITGLNFTSLTIDIDLTHPFYECEDHFIASYANDATLYSCTADTQTVISELHFFKQTFRLV